MAGTLFPYGLRIPTPAYASLLHGGQMPSDVQRAHAAQLYDLSARIRMGLPYPPPGVAPPPPGAGVRPFDPLHYLYSQQDPRSRFFHEEPKPSYSYIGLIAMAILSSKEKKLILSDIYQWVIDNYPYFRTRGTGWRNSIRHNLSLNDCFIKAGRAANGKGHYWAVHSAVVEDFERGDFRRRRAQRKVRKAMGLAVPDEEDSPSPPPPSAETIEWRKRVLAMNSSADDSSRTSPASPTSPPPPHRTGPPPPIIITPHLTPPRTTTAAGAPSKSRKRGFDVASLLAPDDDAADDRDVTTASSHNHKMPHLDIDDTGSDVDVGDDSSSVMNCSVDSGRSADPPTSAAPHPHPALPPLQPASPTASTPWSRPSAFHSLQPSAWRPFLPAAFPLLRTGHPPHPPPPHLHPSHAINIHPALGGLLTTPARPLSPPPPPPAAAAAAQGPGSASPVASSPPGIGTQQQDTIIKEDAEGESAHAHQLHHDRELSRCASSGEEEEDVYSIRV